VARRCPALPTVWVGIPGQRGKIVAGRWHRCRNGRTAAVPPRREQWVHASLDCLDTARGNETHMVFVVPMT
jgi:hypothetical protein